MAQQNIVIGTQDAKAGDTLFDAFGKIEANTTELYSDVETIDGKIDVVSGVTPAAPAGSTFVSDGAGGGEFIRIEGWHQVADSRTTVAVPAQNIATGARTQLIIDAGAIDLQKLSSDATAPYWNTLTNAINPVSAFDTFSLRFDFRAENYAGSAPYMIVELDIGGSLNTIVSETVPLLKGGVEQRILFSHHVFTGSTFLANGGKVFLTYVGTGSCDIFASTAFIRRDSKNYI